jgi:hypothetical protein
MCGSDAISQQCNCIRAKGDSTVDVTIRMSDAVGAAPHENRRMTATVDERSPFLPVPGGCIMVRRGPWLSVRDNGTSLRPPCTSAGARAPRLGVCHRDKWHWQRRPEPAAAPPRRAGSTGGPTPAGASVDDGLRRLGLLYAVCKWSHSSPRSLSPHRDTGSRSSPSACSNAAAASVLFALAPMTFVRT